MKHPNKHFREKPCRVCGAGFRPEAPSHLYCSERCKVDGYDHAYLMRTYGIPLRSYQETFETQGGSCKLCGTSGFKMRDWHRKTLVVDHCHSTGKVRGLLCHNCNRALGLLQDNTDVLARAIVYLEAHREGATTIPQGSTPQANGGGSAGPLFEGEDIVWTRRQRRAVR